MVADRRDLEWLRSKLAWLLSVDIENPGQQFGGTADDSNIELDDLTNQAYEFEVNEARENVTWKVFQRYEDVTWKSSTQLTLPDNLRNRDFIEWRDVTNIATGEPIEFSSFGIEEISTGTFQWGENGPGQDTTIRMFYLADAVEMRDKGEEPVLIPWRFRWLLVWRAGVIAKTVANEDAPAKWVKHCEDIQSQLHSSLSSGRPKLGNAARIQLRNQDDFL